MGGGVVVVVARHLRSGAPCVLVMSGTPDSFAGHFGAQTDGQRALREEPSARPSWRGQLAQQRSAADFITNRGFNDDGVSHGAAGVFALHL